MNRTTNPIALAERILALLEVGSFSATYKYALLSSILDLCIERTTKDGVPPSTLTTRQLAEKVTALYWPHATPYEGRSVLRQGGARREHQAEILSTISEFRREHAGFQRELFHRTRGAGDPAFERLVSEVEWKLIEMPIPRLQVVGRSQEDRFLYEYGWTQAVRRSTVTAYQRGDSDAFNNKLDLQPDVAEGLIALNGVLRPVIQREWALKVAALNSLPEQKLETFLFGSERVSLEPVRGPLRELQLGRCFYCEERLDGRSNVDHFIPWARYPENALENLVVAHDRCNGKKRDFFAALPHLERWRKRTRLRDEELTSIAADVRWPRDADRALSVVTAMYSRLPERAPLWLSADEFLPLDRARLLRTLQDEA